GRTYELEKLGFAEIYPSLDAKMSASDRRAAKLEAVRQALAEGDISAKFVVSSVSGESIIVRYIQLPDMPENELEGAVRWEAEDYIPFPLDEVNLDWVVLGRSEVSGQTKIDILLVAAKKELVADHITMLKELELQPAIVDVNSFAFLNCFELNYMPPASDVVALLDIGAEVSSINIFHAGGSRFSRDISIAGDTVTAGIQQRVGCSFQRAEELKRKEGLPAPAADDLDTDFGAETSLLDTIRGTVERITGETLTEETPEFIASTVIRRVFQNLAQEVKRSLAFFENQSGLSVQKLFVGGGTSLTKNVREFLSHELGIPVDLMDPLRSVGVAGVEKQKVEKIRPHLGVAIGLGLRVFDE
ncbi:MAG: type IV pilus assembly protein PilM, partial [Candidatus Sumerlaeaceae bacterium]|nr:type IV pilus assembly protein PilM [Candidatus Sumerlaeaceae bacterium]